MANNRTRIHIECDCWTILIFGANNISSTANYWRLSFFTGNASKENGEIKLINNCLIQMS